MAGKEGPEPCKCPKDSSDVLSMEMYLAAKHGDLKKIREYLRKGNDVNAQDEDSCTLLASACVTGRIEVVRFLQKIPELHRNIADWTGDTPLMHAARMGHKEVVEELLKHPHQCCLDVEALNNYEDTALSIAVASNRRDIVKLLKETKLPPAIQFHPDSQDALVPYRPRAVEVTFECPICLEKYDTNERRPRSLSCGHTHCTECITQLIYQYSGWVTCAFCRRQHSTRVDAAAKVPVNYAIDEILQQQQY